MRSSRLASSAGDSATNRGKKCGTCAVNSDESYFFVSATITAPFWQPGFTREWHSSYLSPSTSSFCSVRPEA